MAQFSTCSIAERVALKFPEDFASDPLQPEFEHYGPDIVRAAGKGLLHHGRVTQPPPLQDHRGFAGRA